jgi:hypothetical protein
MSIAPSARCKSGNTTRAASGARQSRRLTERVDDHDPIDPLVQSGIAQPDQITVR